MISQSVSVYLWVKYLVRHAFPSSLGIGLINDREVIL